jgi:hypothetical protein
VVSVPMQVGGLTLLAEATATGGSENTSSRLERAQPPSDQPVCSRPKPMLLRSALPPGCYGASSRAPSSVATPEEDHGRTWDSASDAHRRWHPSVLDRTAFVGVRAGRLDGAAPRESPVVEIAALAGYNLGVVLGELGRSADALAAYEEVVAR